MAHRQYRELLPLADRHPAANRHALSRQQDEVLGSEHPSNRYFGDSDDPIRGGAPLGSPAEQDLDACIQRMNMVNPRVGGCRTKKVCSPTTA